jgi:hypothetical protein
MPSGFTGGLLRKRRATLKILKDTGFFGSAPGWMRTFQAGRRMIVQRTKFKRGAAE